MDINDVFTVRDLLVASVGIIGILLAAIISIFVWSAKRLLDHINKMETKIEEAISGITSKLSASVADCMGAVSAVTVDVAKVRETLLREYPTRQELQTSLGCVLESLRRIEDRFYLKDNKRAM